MLPDLKTTLLKTAEGSHSAFEELYNAYFSKSYSFALYFTGTNYLASEVVADVFLNLWKRRARLPGIKNWDSYLYISIRNRALAMRQRDISRTPESSDLFSVSLVAGGGTPEDIVMRDEMEQVIEKAFQQLPERCRLIYYMVRTESMSYRQVADILDISERTVNSQMTIATRKLRACVCQYLDNT